MCQQKSHKYKKITTQKQYLQYNIIKLEYHMLAVRQPQQTHFRMLQTLKASLSRLHQLLGTQVRPINTIHFYHISTAQLCTA